MSAENFHTIKKLPPIEPPIEFQDNYIANTKFPFHTTSVITAQQNSTVIRTTHIQSYASRLTQNIIAKAFKTLDRRRSATKDIYCEKHAAAKLKKQQQKAMEDEYHRKQKFVSNSYSIYGSDSFLNSYYNKLNGQMSNGKNSNSNINIVEPDDDIYDEPNTEYDVIYKDNKDTVLCTKRIVRSLEKKKMDTRAHLYSNTDDLYYEKFRSKSCNNNRNYHICNNHANVSSTNNKFQSNSFQKKFDKFLRSKFLTTNLTPTTTTSSIFYSFCHGNNVSNSCNPNSKTSLNSRLSSSHNSLTVPTNKADDSIFITQAMSHDQLGQNIEISDFYNVPADSDIYTLPIDVIKQEDDENRSYKHRAMSDNNLLGSSSSARNLKFHRSKNKRSKRKKRSDTSSRERNHNDGPRKLSSGNVVSSSHSFTVTHEYRKVSTDKVRPKFTSNNATPTSCDASSKNRSKPQPTYQKSADVPADAPRIVKGSDPNNNSKYGSNSNTAKKSQFSISLNLKQKFCSIFRFKKSHHGSSTLSVSNETQPPNSDEKKVNLSTRALPPLPGKSDESKPVQNLNSSIEQKRENTMDFAANIEKVREVSVK